MLSYDGGDLEKAADCFRRAIAVEEGNAVAQFNLGSVLEEMGELEEARQHLRLAVRLDAMYADAHYNLAFVCEKLSARAEARQHWQQYVELDPGSPWCDYARQRLVSTKA
jgi:tetratricopeptide (TPR) repeat protein